MDRWKSTEKQEKKGWKQEGADIGGILHAEAVRNID